MKVVLLVAILSVLLVAIAFLLLGVKVLFVKNGKFPSSHVHDVEALRNKGIKCAHGDYENNKKQQI